MQTTLTTDEVCPYCKELNSFNWYAPARSLGLRSDHKCISCGRVYVATVTIRVSTDRAAMELGVEKEHVRLLGEITAEHNKLFRQEGAE